MRLIFTVTSGRSGTGLLAKVLDLYENVYSQHEPIPVFHDCMQLGNFLPGIRKQFWEEAKLPVILALAKRHGFDIYAESSHLFCKGFFEPLLELGVNSELIFLTRNSREVASSMLRLDTVPGKSYRGFIYYLTPGAPECFVKIAPDAPPLTDYQRCFWYTQEILSRQQIYRGLAKILKMRFMDLDFETLISENAPEFIGKAMNLPPLKPGASEAFRKLSETPVNAGSNRGALPGKLTSDEMDRQEQELMKYLIHPKS